MSSVTLAEQALTLSRTFDEYAEALRSRGRELWREDEIDEDDYEEVKRTYNKLRGASRDLAAKASTLASQGLDRDLERLGEAVDRLVKARARIDGVADVVTVATKLLGATVAIAALALTPSPATVLAAAVSLESVVKSLVR